jgi:hypothetical protein
VYAILADYRNGRPRILPERYFSNLEVERGRVGAGTVIRFQVRTLGITRSFRGEVTEPKPGRVLVESYPQTGEVTSFTVEPVVGVDERPSPLPPNGSPMDSVVWCSGCWRRACSGGSTPRSWKTSPVWPVNKRKGPVDRGLHVRPVGLELLQKGAKFRQLSFGRLTNGPLFRALVLTISSPY